MSKASQTIYVMNGLNLSLRFLPITYAKLEALRRKENGQHPSDRKPFLGGLRLSCFLGEK